MRCVDLYNHSQSKWFEEMVTTCMVKPEGNAFKPDVTNPTSAYFPSIATRTCLRTILKCLDRILHECIIPVFACASRLGAGETGG